MSPEERICYAMAVDDIAKIGVNFFDEAIWRTKFKDDSLHRTLDSMSCAMHYLKDRSDVRLKSFESSLHVRGQYAVPVAVYMNMARINLQHVKLKMASFCNANLEYADLSNSYLDLSASLQGGLTVTNLSHANLENAVIENTAGAETNFSNANLSFVKMRNGGFSQSSFSNANMKHMELTGEINSSDMTNAVMDGIFFQRSCYGLNLAGTSMIGTMFIEGLYLSKAKNSVVIDPSECDEREDLEIAMTRVEEQMKYIVDFNAEHEHLKKSFFNPSLYLKSAIDNVLQNLNDGAINLEEKNNIVDYLLGYSSMINGVGQLARITQPIYNLFKPASDADMMQAIRHKLLAAKLEMKIDNRSLRSSQ